MLAHVLRQLQEAGSITLTVRARPNARITKLVEVLEDGSLKIDLHAVPEEGDANKELVRFLGEELQVKAYQIEMLSGHQGRQKVVRITR